ncbi:MFS transporter [Acidobacteriota bacterium]
MKKTFWNLWTSYATYYFGKVNLSIVVPALLATYQDLNMYSVGLVSSGFFFAYALGQFLHGQISERFNPFVYISLGLICSGIMNLLLGFSAGFFILLFIGEVLDGGFQAMGWSSIVRANAEIQKSAKERDRTSTILGTSYQAGNSIAWLISAFAVGTWGWRAGFWIASVFLLLRGITLLLTKPKMEFSPKQKVKAQVKATLTFPIVMSGVSLCLLNMVRYGVITWIPLYFFIEGNFSIGDMEKVGLKVFLIPLAGILGTLIYNKIKIDKDVTSIIFLSLLGVSFVVFPFTSGWVASAVLLIGSFFLYGPHVFLVATCPSRFKEKNVVAASTGFIDGMGYIGTVLIGLIVPFLVELGKTSWNYVFAFWAFLSFAVAVVITISYFLHFKKNNYNGDMVDENN